MQLKDIILLILGSLGTLGVAAGGLGFLLQSFRHGTKEDKDSILTSAEKVSQFWKDQADNYKAMMETKDARNDEKIQSLTQKVGELTGQLVSETAQRKRFEEIFQNRNPEMENFMKAVVSDIQNHEAFHSTMTTMLQSMTTVLNDIHAMSTSNHEILQQEQASEMTIEGKVTKK